MKKNYLLLLCAVSLSFVGCKEKNAPTAPKNAQAVDLGLSVKWANMNVGATSPEGCCAGFAWGETSSVPWRKDWSAYKWCEGSSFTMTKYCTSSSYGIVDGKTTLDLEDDAAHVNWGGNWRMPTYDELDELRTQCTWTWTTLNGSRGYQVTGKNGNSIFLPFSSYPSRYWSSSLNADRSDYAYYLAFEDDFVKWRTNERNWQNEVRAVLP